MIEVRDTIKIIDIVKHNYDDPPGTLKKIEEYVTGLYEREAAAAEAEGEGDVGEPGAGDAEPGDEQEEPARKRGQRRGRDRAERGGRNRAEPPSDDGVMTHGSMGGL
jgi:hypothetical protein